MTNLAAARLGHRRLGHLRLIALVAALAFLSEPARACAVCFGKSDSNLAVGMNWGIFTLLFFIVSVLAGLSCFFVFLAVRSSRHPLTGPDNNGPADPSQTS